MGHTGIEIGSKKTHVVIEKIYKKSLHESFPWVPGRGGVIKREEITCRNNESGFGGPQWRKWTGCILYTGGASEECQEKKKKRDRGSDTLRSSKKTRGKRRHNGQLTAPLFALGTTVKKEGGGCRQANMAGKHGEPRNRSAWWQTTGAELNGEISEYKQSPQNGKKKLRGMNFLCCDCF